MKLSISPLSMSLAHAILGSAQESFLLLSSCPRKAKMLKEGHCPSFAAVLHHVMVTIVSLLHHASAILVLRHSWSTFPQSFRGIGIAMCPGTAEQHNAGCWQWHQ